MLLSMMMLLKPPNGKLLSVVRNFEKVAIPKHSEHVLKQITDLKLPLEYSEYDALEHNTVNVIDHYPLYYAMLTLQTPPPVDRVPIFTIKDFPKLKMQLGCRKAHQTMITKYCVSFDPPWKPIK